MKGTTPAEVLTLYGLTLMICGALSFYASGLQSKAMSSIYIGNGSAVICFLLAAGVRNPDVKKGEAGYKLMMICIHLALVFPLVMAAVVGWRLSLSWSVAEKAYVIPYFIGIIVSSILCFAVLYTFKPKKDKSATTTANAKAKQGGADANADDVSAASTASTATEVQRDLGANGEAAAAATGLKSDGERRRTSASGNTQSSGHVVRKRARRATAM